MSKSSQPLIDEDKSVLISVIIKNVIKELSQVQPLKNTVERKFNEILPSLLSRLDYECLFSWSHQIVTSLLSEIKTNKSYSSYLQKEFTIPRKTLMEIAESTVSLLIEEWIPQKNRLILQREMHQQEQAVKKFITAETVMLHPSSEEAKDEDDKDNPFFLVNQFIYLGNLGTVIEILDYKHKGLNYIESAYNETNRLKKEKESLGKLLIIINVMIEFAKQFNEDAKAALLSKYKPQIEYTMRAIDDSYYAQAEGLENIEPIISCGLTDIKTIEIKNQIRKSVLEPIQQAAAKGKWVDYKYGFVNYGISGYLDTQFLQNQLGLLNDEGNMELAISLCFEAINMGIMLSDQKNPICSIVFCRTYPKIVEKIINKHPEYLVDGYILKTSLPDPNSDSLRLLGYELQMDNTVLYNHYFERAIEPFIMERIKTKILDPLELILNGKNTFDNPIAHKEKYIKYFDLGNIKKALGKNLSCSEDVVLYALNMVYEFLATNLTEAISLDCRADFYILHTASMCYILSHYKGEDQRAELEKIAKDREAFPKITDFDQLLEYYLAQAASQNSSPNLSGKTRASTFETLELYAENEEHYEQVKELNGEST